MAVVNMTVGATTPGGATFAIKAENGPVRVAIADNADMTDPVFFGPESLDINDATKVDAIGLDPSTRYWWQVEDNGILDTSITGQFVTHPLLNIPSSFTIGVATCSGQNGGGQGSVLAPDRVSNHPVFDTIKQRALTEGWLGFWHGGDIHYYDLGSDEHGIVGGGSLANYRRSIDDVMLQPRQHELYHSVPWWFSYDDHDRGPNNHDRTFVDGVNADQVYRERIPHYELPDTDPQGATYYSFQIGRVLFIASDVRSARDPNSDPASPDKTMLGQAQKDWMENVLSTTDAQAFCWLMPDQWLRVDGSDTWDSFTNERDELVNMLSNLGWTDRMWMVYGDRHALGLDTGGPSGNAWGGFPVLMAASLDSASGTAMPGVFNTGPDFPGSNQYGTITVNDFGTHIEVRLAGYVGNTLWREHTFGFNTPQEDGPSLIPTPTAIANVISGSHRVAFEARVLTEFQTGPDPDGIEIPVIDGDVSFDANADVRAALDLVTDGRGTWPRRGNDLLDPSGNEIFVRYGIDFGDIGDEGESILWVPLGYYRIDTPQQDDAPDGVIRIVCQDRMAMIIDSELINPREFNAGQTVGAVFDNLVREVFPDAEIIFDDGTGVSTLGRSLIVERSRYEVLHDLATDAGKIMYWNDIGQLEIRSAPRTDFPVWFVNAGQNGVMINASRNITRDGAFNAVVAIGEGADNFPPAHAVAYDANTQSRTFFGGPFGRIPFFHESSNITTSAMARNAAREIMRRNTGFPYSVDFNTVPNPALRPYDPVRIEYSDGNREIHIMNSITIPLTAEDSMSGETREQTIIILGGT